MTSQDLVFVGLNGRVVALDRDSGALRWEWKAAKTGGYMTLLADHDRLIVSAGGYIYCLDPASGQQLWDNPLTGFGVGVAALATLQQRTPDAEVAAAASAQAIQAATTTTMISS